MTNKKFVTIAAVIVAFVVGLVIGIFVGPRLFFGMHHGTFPSGGGYSKFNSTAIVGTLFSNFQFASTSYQISGNATLSPAGKIAVEDFNLTTTPLQNGSTIYSIKFNELSTVYNVTVGKNDKLYFVDSNLADDQPGADTSLGDDGYAVVNSTGYIVAFKYPLPNS